MLFNPTWRPDRVPGPPSPCWEVKGDGTERRAAVTIDAFSPQCSKIKLFLPIKVTLI